MATHSSTLAWKIPWTVEPVGCSPWGLEESDTTERLHFHFSLSCIGEGNGNPLQCSCLKNPRDRGAWWAAVYGVIQSRTRLKRLSSSSSSQDVSLELLGAFLPPVGTASLRPKSTPRNRLRDGADKSTQNLSPVKPDSWRLSQSPAFPLEPGRAEFFSLPTKK